MNGDAKKQKIHDRLQALAVSGRLTPTAVVEDAEDETSPLHREFDWDDQSAAHKHRLNQARSLIQRFQVYVETRETVIAAPAFVRDPEAGPGEQGYRSTTHLRSDRERALDALATEAGRAAAYLGRVHSLAAALGLEDDVDAVLERFSAFRRTVQTGA